MNSPIPVSILFIGLNGFIALTLSCIVVLERTSTRVWHGESKGDISNQPNYLENPSRWAAFIESYTQKSITAKNNDDGVLQRKVRAFGNFMEYAPLALLFMVALELMHSQTWLLWLLGSTLTVGRVAHARGVIQTYGPSPGRAFGFVSTLLVYLVGAIACMYYGTTSMWR